MAIIHELVNDPLTESDEGEKAPPVEWGQNPAED